MRRRTAALAMFLVAAPLLAPASSSGNIPAHTQVTTWSRAAYALPFAPGAAVRETRIVSPDGKKAILCSNMAGERQVSAGISERVQQPACAFVAGEKRLAIDVHVGPEALWAPDSSAVALTQSRGGALGTYNVAIYRADSDEPRDVTGEVRRDLAKRFPACVGTEAACTASQRRAMRNDARWVNVAAIGWVHDSNELVMMAWVPDSTEFGANYGRMNGYVIDARNGKILARYSESQFKQKFKSEFGDWGL